MSQLPVMPLLVDAILGDTLHLSAAEFGAYNLILFATWRNNSLPFADNDTVMARICRMTSTEWRKSRPTIAQFFDLSDGFWRQGNLEKQWRLATERADRARENGNRGGRPKGTGSKPQENPSGFVQGTQEAAQSGSNHNHNHPLEPNGSKEVGHSDDLADAVDDWNALADEAGLAKVGKFTDQRRKSLRNRLDDCGGLPGWRVALSKVRTNPFLRGENDRGWKADFDFLLQAKSFTKLMEGGYDRAQPSAKASGADRLAEPFRELDRLCGGGAGPLESFGDPAGGPVIDQPASRH